MIDIANLHNGKVKILGELFSKKANNSNLHRVVTLVDKRFTPPFLSMNS